MADHMHGGHRARVKERYLTAGIDTFAAHEIVEFLLYYAIPQKDTNETAHRLMQHFGSIRAILNADRDMLLGVEGMTANAATLLNLVGDVRKYCNCEMDPNRLSIYDIERQIEILRPRFEDQSCENVWMLTMDVSGRLLGIHKLSDGTPLEADINIRSVLRFALMDNAVNVVLAHNHPSGVAVPSNADIATTAVIAKTLKAVSIRLYDHLVFTRDGECVSFRQTKSIRDALGGQEGLSLYY